MSLSKKLPLFAAVSLLSLASFFSSVGQGIDFGGVLGGGTVGTKFACCRSENASCLGGGGATIWHTMLKDRALTQVDAKLRCGIYTMRWATQSCPADVPCGDPNPGSTPGHPTPTNYNISFGNSLNEDVYLALKTWGGPTTEVHAWYKVPAHGSKNFTYQDSACIAVSKNGADWIQAAQNSGAIFTGTLSNFTVNAAKKTDVTYGLTNGNYWVNIFVQDVMPQHHYTGFSAEGIRTLFQDAGMKPFKCFSTTKSNLITGAN